MSTLVLVDYSGKRADLEKGKVLGKLDFYWDWIEEGEEEMSEEEYRKYLDDCLTYQEAREKKLREMLQKVQVHNTDEAETAFSEEIAKWEGELFGKFLEKNGNAPLNELKIKTVGKKRILVDFVIMMMERWDELRSQYGES